MHVEKIYSTEVEQVVSEMAGQHYRLLANKERGLVRAGPRQKQKCPRTTRIRHREPPTRRPPLQWQLFTKL